MAVPVDLSGPNEYLTQRPGQADRALFEAISYCGLKIAALFKGGQTPKVKSIFPSLECGLVL